MSAAALRRPSLKERLRRAAAHPRLLSALDQAFFALSPGRTVRAKWHVLIAPPGGGNIGDQAMIEAFLENTTGPIRIVVRAADDVVIPAAHRGRAELVVLPALVYGAFPRHAADIVRFRGLLRQARSLAVVGADIMDGAYNPNASANRATLALLARRLGVPARVLGFSWNGTPHPRAARALRAASKAGTHLYLRDPVSAARARRDGLHNVVDAADTVFAARSVDHATAAELLAGLPVGAPVALVNVSGLVGKAIDQVGEYLNIISALQAAGLRVVLLPHVIRPGADDLSACRAVYERLSDPSVLFVQHILPPAAIRGLTARATIVITGRMHLAIMALYHGVPAITLGTQGKVEGLMQMLDASFLCVEPNAGFGERVTAVALESLRRRAELSAQIAARVALIRERSRLNFPQ